MSLSSERRRRPAVNREMPQDLASELPDSEVTSARRVYIRRALAKTWPLRPRLAPGTR